MKCLDEFQIFFQFLCVTHKFPGSKTLTHDQNIQVYFHILSVTSLFSPKILQTACFRYYLDVGTFKGFQTCVLKCATSTLYGE